MMISNEQRDLILTEYKRTLQDVYYMHDDTRFYDGKMAALEDICRILHIPVPDEE